MTRAESPLFSVLRKIKTGLTLLGGLTLLIGFTPITAWYAHVMAGRFQQPDGSLLIVLSGAPDQDGVLSQNGHLRCLYAVRAWRAGHYRGVLVSGANGASMMNFLVSQGIPPEDLRFENRSSSTHESAVNAGAFIAGYSPVVLLTSDYHMYRARRAFTKAGIAVTPFPIPDGYKRATDWYLRWTVFAEEVRETIKIIGYRFKGWI